MTLPSATGSSAAVVGATGFIGRALTVALRRDGVRVSQFTRSHPCLSPAGVPSAGLADADTLFWAASTVNPSTAERSPAGVRSDQDAFASALDALSDSSRSPRVVLLSSGGTVYDPAAAPPYTESTAAKPIGAYGQAKLALEATLAAARGPAGAGLSVRVSNAYGPGQPAAPGQGVIAHWLAAARAGRPLTLLGDPGTIRDYVYVEDVVRALVSIHHHRDELPGILNIGSGLPTRLDALAELILEVVGDPRVVLRSSPGRPFDVARTWLDCSLAQRVLGWSAKTALRDGVQHTWRVIRSTGVAQPVSGR